MQAGEGAEFSLPLRVYIEDTDAGGIVFYVNFLKYMERARTDFMRSLGLDRRAIFNAEIMFVVSDIALKYHLPARLDDQLEATARLATVRGWEPRALPILAQVLERDPIGLLEEVGQVSTTKLRALLREASDEAREAADADATSDAISYVDVREVAPFREPGEEAA